MKTCLLSAPGGHLAQILCLDRIIPPDKRFFVTFNNIDTRSKLKNEEVIFLPRNWSACLSLQ